MNIETLFTRGQLIAAAIALACGAAGTGIGFLISEGVARAQFEGRIERLEEKAESDKVEREKTIRAIERVENKVSEVKATVGEVKATVDTLQRIFVGGSR